MRPLPKRPRTMLLPTLNNDQEKVILRLGKSEGHQDETATLASTRINRALQPTAGYLCRLRNRMEKVGFPDNDPLFQLVEQVSE
jgi:hypothetical protein